ncbi:hypothetical protein BDV19DRAFT_390688 [Aspergillus venezuelensis]
MEKLPVEIFDKVIQIAVKENSIKNTLRARCASHVCSKTIMNTLPASSRIDEALRFGQGHRRQEARWKKVPRELKVRYTENKLMQESTAPCNLVT